MQNQNLFALLPDDADVSYAIPSPNHAVAVVATADPKKRSAGQKKKPINQSSDGSDPNDKRLNHSRPVNRRDVVINKSKSELQGQAPKDTDRVGYQQRSVGSNIYRSANVVSNGGGANGNYKGNSFQKNYNSNQDSYGAGDNVPSRGRGGGRDYGGRGRGRGRNNSGEQRLSDYSNGSQPRRGNGRGFQSHPFTESQGLKFESNEVPNKSQTEINDLVGDNEGWQVVGRRKQGSGANSEVRSELSYNSEAKDDQSDGLGLRSNGVVNGQTGHHSRANGTYYNDNATKSVASNNSEIKEDIVEAVQAGSGDSINVNSVEEEISAEEEERKRKHEKWLKEKEEDEKKMTLKQYEKECKENQKNVPLREPRVVALDKELEAMQPVGKKKDLVLPLIMKDGSESSTDVPQSSIKNKEKKKVTTAPHDSVCKSIVQGFMKTASFQRQRYNKRADEGSYYNGNGFFNKGNAGQGSYPKGNVAKGFSLSDKSNVVAKGTSDPVEGTYRKGSAATDKGNTFEGKLPKEKGVEMKNDISKGGKSEAVKSKEIVVSIKFDDHAQFPALQ